MTNSRLTITALITTFNSAKTLYKALKSVDWCDEILVVDSFSTDETLEIAAKFGSKIVQREYPGSSRQLEYGVSISGNDIVLILDSDEEVTEILKKEIVSILESGNFNHGGYVIPRSVFFQGKWINYGEWSGDLQYRLIKKQNTRFIHRHDAHWGIESDYPFEQLKGIIYHYTYENIFDYIGRMNIYSSLDVRTKFNMNPGLKLKWYNLILNPLSDFLRMFIVHKGYKDGMHGFVLALLSAIHKMTAYSKMWEYKYCKENGLELPPVTYPEFKKQKKN